MIMYHILLKERERPSDEIVYSRLTDGWWNLCLSCWHRDPLLRPSMSDLVKNIRALQVCCEASNPKYLTENIPYTQTISKIDASPLPCEVCILFLRLMPILTSALRQSYADMLIKNRQMMTPALLRKTSGGHSKNSPDVQCDIPSFSMGECPITIQP